MLTRRRKPRLTCQFLSIAIVLEYGTAQSPHVVRNCIRRRDMGQDRINGLYVFVEAAVKNTPHHAVHGKTAWNEGRKTAKTFTKHTYNISGLSSIDRFRQPLRACAVCEETLGIYWFWKIRCNALYEKELVLSLFACRAAFGGMPGEISLMVLCSMYFLLDCGVLYSFQI